MSVPPMKGKRGNTEETIHFDQMTWKLPQPFHLPVSRNVVMQGHTCCRGSWEMYSLTLAVVIPTNKGKRGLRGQCAAHHTVALGVLFSRPDAPG